MAQVQSNTEFAKLFKRYRLRSEIETLSEFGDLLAEEGYIYEDSLFTKWQSGERVPKDRKLILKMIEIFAKKRGLREIFEANQFLEVTNQRDLREEEKNQLQEFFNIGTKTLPDPIDIFVGRKNIIEKVEVLLISKKKVLLFGQPGIGKTALGIQIGHLLKDKFHDGVLWLRADLKSLENIVDELLLFLGYDLKIYPSVDYKIEQLISISHSKDYIVILDNLDKKAASSPIFSKLLNTPVAFLITSTNRVPKEKEVINFHIQPFTLEEYLNLASIILGHPFVFQNKEELVRIGQSLGFLPISSTIILKQIYADPTNLKKYLNKVGQNILKLENLRYDDKNLYSSFTICFEELSRDLQTMLISCSVFDGHDFDVKIVSKINGLSQDVTDSQILSLVNLSFIEPSVKGRYRINPTAKIYLQEKITGQELYRKLINYYVARNEAYKNKYVGDKIPYAEIAAETDNIIGLIKRCDNLKLYKDITQLWLCINTYLWLSGKWNIVISLRSILRHSFLASRDEKGYAYYLINDLGRVFFFQKNTSKAIMCLEYSQKIASKTNDTFLAGSIKQKYGILALKRGNYKVAEHLYIEAINLLCWPKYNLELIKTYIFLSELFIKLKMIEKSLTYIKRAYNLSFKRNIEDTLGMASLYMGYLYFNLKKYSLSEFYFQKSIIIEKKLKREIGMALAYQGIAQIAAEREHLKLALRLYNVSIDQFKKLGMKEQLKHTLDYKRKLMKRIEKK